jgi:hypothetical protein
VRTVQVSEMTEPSKGAIVSANLPLRANAYPKEGFSMVVDGKFKQHFATLDDAQKAAMRLKNKFPLLQVAVRDAITAERSPVNLPE